MNFLILTDLKFVYSYLKKNLAKYLGIEFYSTVVRNGKEITYLAENKYYDFNFQFLNFLTKLFSN